MQEAAAWSKEMADLRDQVQKAQNLMKETRHKNEILQHENANLTTALNDHMPNELIKTKYALDIANRKIDELTMRNDELLTNLKQSSPMEELTKLKMEVERAHMVAQRLREENDDMLTSMQAGLQAKLQEARNLLQAANADMNKLKEENRQLNETIAKTHPMELMELQSQLDQVTVIADRLRERNESLNLSVRNYEEKLKQQKIKELQALMAPGMSASDDCGETLQQKKELAKLLSVATE